MMSNLAAVTVRIVIVVEVDAWSGKSCCRVESSDIKRTNKTVLYYVVMFITIIRSRRREVVECLGAKDARNMLKTRRPHE